jgi:hypothetical protein
MEAEKKDRLEIIQELFKEVGMQGDQAHAAKKAGFVSQVVSKALNKNSWSELTSGEITGLIELHKLLAKRKKDLAEIDSTELNR